MSDTVSPWARAVLLGIVLDAELEDPDAIHEILSYLPSPIDWPSEVRSQAVEPLDPEHYDFLDRCVPAAAPGLIIRFGVHEFLDSEWLQMDMCRAMGFYLGDYARDTQDLALAVWQGLLIRAGTRHRLGVETWPEGTYLVEEAWTIAAKLTGATPFRGLNDG